MVAAGALHVSSGRVASRAQAQHTPGMADLAAWLTQSAGALSARAAELWGADALEFKPERWLDEAYVAGINPFAYRPFSKGPR